MHVLSIFNPQSDRDFSFTKGDENYLEEWRASRRAYNPLNLTDRLIIIWLLASVIIIALTSDKLNLLRYKSYFSALWAVLASDTEPAAFLSFLYFPWLVFLFILRRFGCHGATFPSFPATRPHKIYSVHDYAVFRGERGEGGRWFNWERAVKPRSPLDRLVTDFVNEDVEPLGICTGTSSAWSGDFSLLRSFSFSSWKKTRFGRICGENWIDWFLKKIFFFYMKLCIEISINRV